MARAPMLSQKAIGEKPRISGDIQAVWRINLTQDRPISASFEPSYVMAPDALEELLEKRRPMDHGAEIAKWVRIEPK